MFVLATYGEGDPTDNAVTFDQFIRNEETDLSGLNFSVSRAANSLFKTTIVPLWAKESADPSGSPWLFGIF